MNPSIKYFFMIFLMISLFSCKKADNTVEDEVNIPGMGETPGELQGTPFKLPASIQVLGSIDGWSSDRFSSSISGPLEMSKLNKGQENKFNIGLKQKVSSINAVSSDLELCQEIGVGRWVALFLNLKNTSNSPVTFTIPAGLMFKSLNPEDQSGIVIGDHIITIPAGTELCRVLINTFCLNADRDPSSSSSRYSLGLITNARPMVELINLLKNKALTREHTVRIQSLVWSITDYGGLTEEDRELITELPNK